MIAKLKLRYVRLLDQLQERRKAKYLDEKRRELFQSAFITFNRTNTYGKSNRSLGYRKVRTTTDRTHLFS